MCHVYFGHKVKEEVESEMFIFAPKEKITGKGRLIFIFLLRYNLHVVKFQV